MTRHPENVRPIPVRSVVPPVKRRLICFSWLGGAASRFRGAVQGLEPRRRNISPHIPWQIFYTEGVEAHWRETTVGEHGELVLEGLPFDPGQAVEVLVVSKASGSTGAGALSLQGSVLEFREPLEPVASEDWDALQ